MIDDYEKFKHDIAWFIITNYNKTGVDFSGNSLIEITIQDRHFALDSDLIASLYKEWQTKKFYPERNEYSWQVELTSLIEGS